MKVEIDQSGKIENTSINSVIADSLGNYIVLNTETKRYLLNIFRSIGKPKMFTIQTFATVVYLLIIKHHKQGNIYVVDTEYFGRMNDVKSYIHLYLQQNKNTQDITITFGFVGKKSLAHIHAYDYYRTKKVDSGKIILKEKISDLLFKKAVVF